jgi:hypothetical protein
MAKLVTEYASPLVDPPTAVFNVLAGDPEDDDEDEEEKRDRHQDDDPEDEEDGYSE